MAATGDGVGDFMGTAGTITAMSSSYSYAFWYKALAAPGTGSIKVAVSLTAAGGDTYDIEFDWNHTNAAFFKGSTHLNNGGGTSTVQFSGTPPDNVWIHIAITYGSSTLKLYLNGVLDNTAASSGSPSGAQGSPRVGVLAFKNGTGGFDDATMAELAVWNTTLTAAQVFDLYNGTLPTATAFANLLFYDQLNTGVATITGPTLTNSGCTLNTTYFFGMTGGPAAGGAGFTTVTAYAWEFTGGVSVGGAGDASFPVTSLASFEDTITMDESTEQTAFFIDSLVITPSFPLPIQHGTIVETIRFKDKFSVVGQPLASNRAGAYTTK